MKTTRSRSAARTQAAERSSGSAGSKILAAIEEATEVLRSEGLRSRRLTVRTYKTPTARPDFGPGDVRRVRDLLGASQGVLARFLGVNVNTVRSWEQGKRPPQPIACRFMMEIESDPDYWRRRVERAAGRSPTGEPTE
jgi:putative transcriptional regulator